VSKSRVLAYLHLVQRLGSDASPYMYLEALLVVLGFWVMSKRWGPKRVCLSCLACACTYPDQRQLQCPDHVSAPRVSASNCLLAPGEGDNVLFDQPVPECEDDGENENFSLSYMIPRATLEKLRSSPKPVYWSHTFYRNAQAEPIKVHYASNLEESEALAKRFLKEKVIGFDS
jgi:hypothetical protein